MLLLGFVQKRFIHSSILSHDIYRMMHHVIFLTYWWNWETCKSSIMVLPLPFINHASPFFHPRFDIHRHATFMVWTGIPAGTKFEAKKFLLKILFVHWFSSFINYSSPFPKKRLFFSLSQKACFRDTNCSKLKLFNKYCLGGLAVLPTLPDASDELKVASL